MYRKALHDCFVPFIYIIRIGEMINTLTVIGMGGGVLCCSFSEEEEEERGEDERIPTELSESCQFTV